VCNKDFFADGVADLAACAYDLGFVLCTEESMFSPYKGTQRLQRHNHYEIPPFSLVVVGRLKILAAAQIYSLHLNL
jgi:hypothetical protein